MKKVYASCVVRPFWFTTDKMSRVTKKKRRELLGLKDRAGHLRHFKRSGDIEEIKRRLILTAKDIAGIMLTAVIDLELNSKIRRKNWTGKDIPEIDWFQQEVNLKRGVELTYTFDDGISDLLKELEDRLVFEEGKNVFFVKFSFLEGEHSPVGNLELGFKEKDEFYRWLSHPQTPSVYNTFEQLLSTLSQDNISLIWEEYQRLWDCLPNKLTAEYIGSLGEIDNYQKLFLTDVMTLAKSHQSNSIIPNSDSLVDVYKGKVNLFKKNGCLPIALIFEKIDSEFPVRTASWQKNSQKILSEPLQEASM